MGFDRCVQSEWVNDADEWDTINIGTSIIEMSMKQQSKGNTKTGMRYHCPWGL